MIVSYFIAESSTVLVQFKINLTKTEHFSYYQMVKDISFLNFQRRKLPFNVIKTFSKLTYRIKKYLLWNMKKSKNEPGSFWISLPEPMYTNTNSKLWYFCVNGPKKCFQIFFYPKKKKFFSLQGILSVMPLWYSYNNRVSIKIVPTKNIQFNIWSSNNYAFLHFNVLYVDK